MSRTCVATGDPRAPRRWMSRPMRMRRWCAPMSRLTISQRWSTRFAAVVPLRVWRAVGSVLCQLSSRQSQGVDSVEQSLSRRFAATAHPPRYGFGRSSTSWPLQSGNLRRLSLQRCCLAASSVGSQHSNRRQERVAGSGGRVGLCKCCTGERSNLLVANTRQVFAHPAGRWRTASTSPPEDNSGMRLLSQHLH